MITKLKKKNRRTTFEGWWKRANRSGDASRWQEINCGCRRRVAKRREEIATFTWALANVTERKYTRAEWEERVSSLQKLGGLSTLLAQLRPQIVGRYCGQRDLLLYSNCTGLFYLPFYLVFLSLFTRWSRKQRSTQRSRADLVRAIRNNDRLSLPHTLALQNHRMELGRSRPIRRSTCGLPSV